ncbi:MAG: hypothetical protein ACR2PG_05265 [Hyphomicrobiaceae bacterium]
MPGDSDLAKELASLRADIESLKAAQSRHSLASGVDGEGEGEGDDLLDRGETGHSRNPPGQTQDIDKAIREFMETVEADISANPVAAIGAALLLGIVIGRLST